MGDDDYGTVATAAAVDILGYSCRFPESESPSGFWDNLVSGRDMVTEDARRWPIGLHGTPGRFGKLKEYHLFDATFFSVHGKQAQRMDPQMRKLLEVSHEAFVDSGVDHKQLRGSDKVGVYLGCCGSEVHALWLGDINNITGYEQTGCTMSMFANRLSFFYNFKGPSKAVDTACSSAFMALHDAVQDLQRGKVDYAVVGGSSAIFRPATSLAFLRLKMLSPDGACKSFDASGNGYARAEGVAAVILRRADVEDTPWVNAREPYARILGIGTNNDGHTEQGITFPSGPAQRELGLKVCQACGVDPADVAYVEAHGTGTVVGDSQELMAIDGLYGAAAGHSAEEPLLIGSVKSNMGHCEGASGLAGLIKVCLAYEHGVLPGNLHYKEPNPNNESLKNGILKVVTEPTPWQGGLVAISSFGFGGSNVHALIAGVVRPKGPPPMALPPPPALKEGETIIEEASEADDPLRQIPSQLIVPLAARTKDGVEKLINSIKARAMQAKELAEPLKRLANTLGADVHKLPFRGTICNGQAKYEQCKMGHAAPVWFVFSGNGSQWPRMAVPLMAASPAFRRAVHACADAVAPHGLDLLAELDREDGYSHPSMAMVGLVAIQVGLVDMLRAEYGIEPAGMLGHSAGEIPCGYADGCLSLEQTVLTAYHRGRLAPEHGLTGGLMAAVGLSAEAADTRLAKEGLTEVVVGCDNSPQNVTLAGPEAQLAPLLAKLKDEGIFVRELATLGIAYHSPALQPFTAPLHKALAALIPDPKERSKRWLSTSFPLDTEDPEAARCGPGYHVQSYRNRVLFRAACEAIPEDAVLLEVGPHALLRAPLRQNCKDLPYVNVMKKGEDAELSAREAVAGLWRKGAALAWDAAPASASAPAELPRDVRESLVSWNHGNDYECPTYEDYGARINGQFEKVWDLGGDHKFLADHVVDGRILMPATSYVVTAWEAVATRQGKQMHELPVTFENVQIHQAVPVEEGQKVVLAVLLAPNNRFHVIHAGDMICDGHIKPVPVAAKPEVEEVDEANKGPVAVSVPADSAEGSAAPTAETDALVPAMGGADTAAAPAKPEITPVEQPAPCTPRKAMPAEEIAPSLEALPETSGTAEVPADGAAASPSKSPVKKKEEEVVDDGDRDELWMHKWTHEPMETIQKEPFYRVIGRTGIQYGPCFRMVKRVNVADNAAMMRWDKCWIRLLDGMLQLSVADTKDHELRIPVRIRRIAIHNAVGTEDRQILCSMDRLMDSVSNELATIAGLELMLAPRKSNAAVFKTNVEATEFVPYGIHIVEDADRMLYNQRLLSFSKQRLLPALATFEEEEGPLPEHLAKIRVMCENLKVEALNEGEVEDLLAHPNHCLARLVNDVSKLETATESLKKAMQTIVAHPEHEHVYDKDPACRSFTMRELRVCADIMLENMPTGFRVVEMGSGTGGLTKNFLPFLDGDMHSEMLYYCATDITNAFASGLADAIRSPKMDFKVWDINNGPGSDLGGKFNIAVATNVLHTAKSLSDVLANINEALEEGGFLMFFEITAILPTLLWGLDAQCWNFTDEREFGLWVNVARWEGLLEQAGFQRVLQFKDELDQCALFLYRKMAATKNFPTNAPLLIQGPPVEASEEYMTAWLEDYQKKAKEVAGIKDKPEGEAQAPEVQAAAAIAEKPAEPAAEEQGAAEAEDTAATERLNDRRLWLYGSTDTSPGTPGLYKTARTEPLGERLRLLFNANTNLAPAAGGRPDLADVESMLAKAVSLDLTVNIFKDGVWGCYRKFLTPPDAAMCPAEEAPAGAHMEIGNYGDLNTLHWVQNRPISHPDLVHCAVTYGALNFKDVMLAYGKLNRDAMSNGYIGCRLGFEFSGRLESRRVMGVAAQAIATHCDAPKYLVWDVPAAWTLRDAATVPVAYLTAYYALVTRGNMQPHHKVLIHSGTGAVGLAAIRICFHRGCEVFTTCGSEAKRKHLLETFPQLRDDHIGDSRSCQFEEMIMHQTGALGVDLALNSLADDKLLATVRCLATNGQLLEIGKYDILKGTALSMYPMHHNIAFQGINLDSLFKGVNRAAVWDTHKLLADGIASGEVQPLPYTVYSRQKVQDAFRFLAGGTHMGKVLIQVAVSEEVARGEPGLPAPVAPAKHPKAAAAAAAGPVAAPRAAIDAPASDASTAVAAEDPVAGAEGAAAAPAGAETAERPPASAAGPEEASTSAPEPEAAETTEPTPDLRITKIFVARADRAYLITGGLGGFGLALAVWLANRGAKYLVLSSKRGLRTGEQMKVILKLREQGVTVDVTTLDVTVAEQAALLVSDIEAQAPIAGIFHLAMVLDDRLLARQTGESWNRAVHPKALGAWNLHELSLKGLPVLENFVMFSSIVSSIGHQGQANYSYANSCVDALCGARRALGLPAQSLAWGPVADVGFVAEVMQGMVRGRMMDIAVPQPIDDCLRVLGEMLAADQAVGANIVIAATKLRGSSDMDDDGKGLVETVMDLLGIDPNSIGENDNLSGMGIDSMQVVEVRARLQRALGRPFPLEEIGTLTLAKLRVLEKESGMTGKPGDKKSKGGSANDAGSDPVDGGDAREPLLPKSEAGGAAAAGAAPAARSAEGMEAAAAAFAASGRDIPKGVNAAELLKGFKTPNGDAVINVGASASVDEPEAPVAPGPRRPLLPTLAWAAMTLAGLLYMSALICLCAYPVVHFTVQLARATNMWIALPVIPAAWLAFGVLLMVATWLTKRLFQPTVAAHRPIRMFTAEFARWWLVQRMIGVTNLLFADQLRGTTFLVWWFRLLGARIGKNCYIDSTDISDCDLVVVGDDVAINEGATILGHYFKDGMLHFGQVVIGNIVSLQPYSVVQPGSKVADKTELGPLRKTKSAIVAEKKDPFAFMKKAAAAAAKGGSKPGSSDTLHTEVHSAAMPAALFSLLQLAVLYAIGALVALCAYAGFAVAAGLCEAFGFWAALETFGAGYAAAGLLGLLSPVLVAVLPVLAPSLMYGGPHGQLFFMQATTHLGILGVVVAFGIGYIVFGTLLALTTTAMKWLIVCRAQAGVHRRVSLYGLRFWASQRLIETAFRRFVCQLQGTWLINVYLRALGAHIGPWATFRFMNVQLAPDMLAIGEGAHIGDLANLVTSTAPDAHHILVAPIDIQPQVLLGITALVMPGAKLGRGAVLGAIAVADIGQTLAPEMLHMGVPSHPLTKQVTGGIVKPTSAAAMAIFWLAPIVLPIAFALLLGLAIFFTAWAAVMLVSTQPVVASILLLPALFLCTASSIMALVVASKWLLNGRAKRSSYLKYSVEFMRKIIGCTIMVVMGQFALLEMARGSYWHCVFMRALGSHIEREVFFDTISFLDFDLGVFQSGAVVARNAAIFCHVGMYRSGGFHIDQARSVFGAGSQMAARSASVLGFNLGADASVGVLELGIKPFGSDLV